MTTKLTSILLVGFAALFLFIILGWGMFKSLIGLNNPQYSLARSRYDRLKRIHISYRVILILFVIVSLVDLLFPSTQKWFVHISWLDNDYINAIGFMILLTAVISVLYFQLKLDKSLHLYYFNSAEQGNSQIVPRTEHNLLRSILLVYVGIFVVVSTLATGILLSISVLAYYGRISSRKYKIRTPISR